MRSRHQFHRSQNRAQRSSIRTRQGESGEIHDGVRMLMGVQPSPHITFWRCMGEADQYHPKSIGSYVRWIGQNSIDTQATGHADGRSGSHRQRQADICAAIRPRRPSASISRNVTHYENTSNYTNPRSVPPPWHLRASSLEEFNSWRSSSERDGDRSTCRACSPDESGQRHGGTCVQEMSSSCETSCSTGTTGHWDESWRQ